MGCQSCFQDKVITEKLLQATTDTKKSRPPCNALLGWTALEELSLIPEKPATAANPTASSCNGIGTRGQNKDTVIKDFLNRNVPKTGKEFHFRHYVDTREYIGQYRREHVAMRKPDPTHGHYLGRAVGSLSHFIQTRQQTRPVEYVPDEGVWVEKDAQHGSTSNGVSDIDHSSTASGSASGNKTIRATFMNGIFTVAQKYNLAPSAPLIQVSQWWRSPESVGTVLPELTRAGSARAERRLLSAGRRPAGGETTRVAPRNTKRTTGAADIGRSGVMVRSGSTLESLQLHNASAATTNKVALSRVRDATCEDFFSVLNEKLEALRDQRLSTQPSPSYDSETDQSDFDT